MGEGEGRQRFYTERKENRHRTKTMIERKSHKLVVQLKCLPSAFWVELWFDSILVPLSCLGPAVLENLGRLG